MQTTRPRYGIHMGTPLVALHGFTGSPLSYREVIAGCPASLVISTPTLPGHDGTDPPSDLGAVLHVVDEAIRTLGAPVTLAGYSLGGRLALHFALSRPERVANLVILGSRPGLSDEKERANRLHHDQKLATLLRQDGLEAFLAHWESLALLRPTRRNPEAIARSRAIRRRHEAGGLARCLEVTSVAALPNLWPRLTDLRIPVTWCAGSDDTTYTELMKKAAERTGEYVQVPGSGHSVLVDAPEAVSRVLCRVSGCST